MQLSFFYKRTQPSGKIRGQQIADYLIAKHNPLDGFEEDVCVYAKRFPPDDPPKNTVVDIVDSRKLIYWVNAHPDAKVIAISKIALNYLKRKLKRDDIYLIPEHHCNFENDLRHPKPVTTVGYMGCRSGSTFPDDMEERFAKIGLKFVYTRKYKTRQDVVDFYKTIDIQVMHRYTRHTATWMLKNPLKLANAGSFGIPSVAYPEVNFIEEFKDCFAEAETFDEMINQCKMLKEHNSYYRTMAAKARLRSKHYHIDKIAPLYKKLCTA